MPSSEADAIYEVLLQRYKEKEFLNPTLALDSAIRSLTQKGRTREEALQELNASESPWTYSPNTDSTTAPQEEETEQKAIPREDVFLDRMDGYQFQKFTASLFQKLGFSKVEVGPTGADEGIDVKMEQRTEVGTIRYVVECKHQTEHMIGRPVVQKLHSALIAKSMNKGIIVTSGHFSSEAMYYAENVGIELVDIDKLKGLAEKVGLSVHLESAPWRTIDNCFPISAEASLAYSCYSYLKNKLIGYRDGMAKIENLSLTLLSAYMVDYSINAKFSTSTGVIHSIRTNSTVFLDGKSLRVMDSELTDPFVGIKHKVSEIREGEIGAELIEKGEFAKSFTDVKGEALKMITQLNTRTISYYGKNNVRYSKTCIPRRKDIVIRNMKRVYLPIWTIGFSILKNKYLVTAAETSETLNVYSYPRIRIPENLHTNFKSFPNRCDICYEDVRKEAYLCEECGAIICKRDKFNCKVCGKAVCRNDMMTKRKYIVLTERYCTQCARK